MTAAARKKAIPRISMLSQRFPITSTCCEHLARTLLEHFDHTVYVQTLIASQSQPNVDLIPPNPKCEKTRENLKQHPSSFPPEGGSLPVPLQPPGLYRTYPAAKEDQCPKPYCAVTMQGLPCGSRRFFLRWLSPAGAQDASAPLLAG
jgi:hypothetical protein